MSGRNPRQYPHTYAVVTVSLLAAVLVAAAARRAPAANASSRGESVRTSLPADPPCVVANKWVAANKDRLPTRLAEFGRHPIVYRQAIYNALSAKTKASLWREHLGGIMASSGSSLNMLLSAKQMALIAEFMANIDTIVQDDNVKGRAAAAAFYPRIVASFGKPLGKEIFATLGPSEFRSSGIFYGPERLINAPGADKMTYCTCSSDSDYCWWLTYCITEWVGGCEWRNGCGTGFVYACDGNCTGVIR